MALQFYWKDEIQARARKSSTIWLKENSKRAQKQIKSRKIEKDISQNYIAAKQFSGDVCITKASRDYLFLGLKVKAFKCLNLAGKSFRWRL